MLKWVKQKQELQSQPPEELVFIGQSGVAGVIDGKLPNGDDYLWAKRRDTKDTKYKGRRR